MVRFPFNHVKELKLSHICAKRQVKAWGRFFFYSDLKFTARHVEFEMRRTLVSKFFFTLKL